jgi:cullin 1
MIFAFPHNKHQRNGDTIDHTLAKKVVDSFVPLELDDSDLNRVCVGTYKEHFENPLIAATEIHYRQESEVFSAANSVLDYFKKVEE